MLKVRLVRMSSNGKKTLMGSCQVPDVAEFVDRMRAAMCGSTGSTLNTVQRL